MTKPGYVTGDKADKLFRRFTWTALSTSSFCKSRDFLFSVSFRFSLRGFPKVGTEKHRTKAGKKKKTSFANQFSEHSRFDGLSRSEGTPFVCLFCLVLQYGDPYHLYVGQTLSCLSRDIGVMHMPRTSGSRASNKLNEISRTKRGYGDLNAQPER